MDHIILNIKALIFKLLIMSLLVATGSCREESFSPSETDSFIKFFGHHGIYEAVGVITLDGGGYLLAGNTLTDTTGSNIILIYTDKFGNETGSAKHFGGVYDDRANTIISLSDGGFAILGSTTVNGDGGSLVTNMYLIRTDSNGDELWTKNYGELSGNETGYSLAETRDGGFVLLGSTEISQTGKKNIFMVKTDAEGESEGIGNWTRIHGGFDDDNVGYGIAETEYGYIYTGYTRRYSQSGPSDTDILIYKTNSRGHVFMPATYDNRGDDIGKLIIPHPEGGYLILGTTSNPLTNIQNIYLSHIEEDILSNPAWTRSFGGSTSHVATCMKITPEGNYVITGTQVLTDQNQAVFLLKTDPEGNEIFFNTYGGSGRQRAQSVDLTPDGGYIIVGSSETGDASMITLIKTDANGEL